MVSNCNNGCIGNNLCKCFDDFQVDSSVGCRPKLSVADCSNVANCYGGGTCVGNADKVKVVLIPVFFSFLSQNWWEDWSMSMRCRLC